MSKLWLSIQERKNRPGCWLLVVERDGQRTTRSFSSYDETKRAEREIRRAEQTGQLKVQAKSSPVTLSSICKDFLASKAREGSSQATLDVYHHLLDNSVLRRLGPHRHPGTVRAVDVEQLRDTRLEEVSATTVFRELDRLRALFGYAKKKGIVRFNVVLDVDFPKIKPKAYDWLRSPEIAPFLEACVGDFATIAKVAIFSGLRRREVVFLQRSDVDLHNNVISIRSKPHLGFRPKSGKERSIPIDPVLRPLLATHLDEEVAPGPESWVFAQSDRSRRSDRTRWLAVSTQAAAARAGISRKLTFHDLRRTYGAMLIEAGVDIYTVSRLLGHADVRITQQVYAPLCGKFLAQEASKLGRHIGRALIREVASVPELPKIRG
jgi:integrase